MAKAICDLSLAPVLALEQVSVIRDLQGSKVCKCETLSRVRLFATGSSVPGIFLARVLEWVAIPFSRGSSRLGIKLASPALQSDSFTALSLSHQGICLFMAVLGLSCDVQAFSSFGQPGATIYSGAQASRCGGFSC